MKGYYLGLVLSLALTLSAYFIATSSFVFAAIAIGVCASLQMLVQFVCFLRLGETEVQTLTSWNVIFFLFTALITLIIVIGSLWIMYNLNYRM